jgi:hypothetical protein
MVEEFVHRVVPHYNVGWHWASANEIESLTVRGEVWCWADGCFTNIHLLSTPILPHNEHSKGKFNLHIGTLLVLPKMWERLHIFRVANVIH